MLLMLFWCSINYVRSWAEMFNWLKFASRCGLWGNHKASLFKKFDNCICNKIDLSCIRMITPALSYAELQIKSNDRCYQSNDSSSVRQISKNTISWLCSIYEYIADKKVMKNLGILRHVQHLILIFNFFYFYEEYLIVLLSFFKKSF